MQTGVLSRQQLVMDGLADQRVLEEAVNAAEHSGEMARGSAYASAALAEIDLDPPPEFAAYLTRVQAALALVRGDTDTAVRLVSHARALNAERSYNAQLVESLARVDADAALLQRRPDDALIRVESALRALREPRRSWRYLWPLLVVGARAGADSVDHAAHLRDEPAVQHLQERLTWLDGWAEEFPPVGPVATAQRATFVAERARPGRSGAGLWRAAAAEWEKLARPHERAYALFRAAEATVVTAGSDSAVPLREAHRIASDLEALPLIGDIEALARRARLPLGTGDGQQPGESAASGGDDPGMTHPDRFGLTAREVDVLGLLSAGRSNREIAAELYISPKTASVHVSNLLGKLGVSSRLEAATMAHRLGLTEVPGVSRRAGRS